MKNSTSNPNTTSELSRYNDILASVKNLYIEENTDGTFSWKSPNAISEKFSTLVEAYYDACRHVETMLNN